LPHIQLYHFQGVRMKFLITIVLSLASFLASATITIEGSVTDQQGKPVKKCDVFFNKDKWITDGSVHVTCDSKGRYRAEIQPGHYNSIYICDEEKYGKTALEFWGWNLNLDQSQTIDAQFDTLEVYSLATWASNGGSNSLFASFRPMSLKEASHKNKTVNGKVLAILDITPAIGSESIKGFVDGQPIELLNHNWTYEKVGNCNGFPKDIDTSNGCYMPMIVAQFKRPKLAAGQHTLKVRLTDAKTANMGEGITHFVANDAGLGF